jgi:carbonic anhydrase
MAGNGNQSSISAEQAMERLVAGNERFRNGATRLSKQTRADLTNLAQGQHPFASILGCSDSRVSPELIFDACLGELFVIRVAGNVLSPEVAASLQYAGSHLNTPLFVVLGHERCGAISAALATRDHGAEQRSRIQLLVNAILPGLQEFTEQGSPETRLSEAVESNVRWTVRQIVESTEGRLRVAEGHMKAVGAIYDLASGCVRFLI